MKQRVKRIGPHSAGKVLGIMYFAMALVIMPVIAIGAVLRESGALAAATLAVAAPFGYAIAGYVGGALLAMLYNGTVRFVGGITIEVEAER